MKRNKEDLRIAIIGDYPSDSTRMKGGVQAAFAYLVSGLVKLDNLELHILTRNLSNCDDLAQIKQNGVNVHLLPKIPRFERIRNFRTYRNTLKYVVRQIQPDLIHAQEAGADAYASLRTGYPTLVTLHGIRQEDSKYISSWSRRLRFYFDSLTLERYCVAHMRYTIAISNYVIDYFTAQLRPDVEVYHIPNAIQEGFFSLSSVSQGQTILFVGRITPLKRVMDLVQAFAQVVKYAPLARLHLVGESSSEPSYVEDIRRWINQTDLGEQQFKGELSQEAILREYAECCLVVLPSSQENAPMVIAQAMAAGKPVIGTRVGGVGEMLGDKGERGFLIDVGNVNGLAQAIMKLLQNSELRSQLGRAGATYAQKHYHSDHVALQTYEVYKRVVAKERSRDA